ncbi:type II secretory pathway, component HofQ domain protein [Burkholderia pseudomallei MSHR1153]|nr:type II secretory pathway, component HofQ domain protein [Burkholderia pseudomallei MSHR1153]
MTARAMRGFDRARIRGAPRGASRSRAFGVERSLFARSSMERRWNAGGRVRMRLRRLPSEDERFRRAAAAVAAVRHVGMSAARPVAHCAAQSCAEPRAIAVLEMPRGQRRRRESNRAQRAGRVLSRPIGATFAMRIVKERGERREVARVYHPGRLEGWKAGRLEGWKAGRREGGKAWDGVCPFAPSYVVVHRDEGRGAHYRRGRWQRPGSSRVNRRRALGGFGFGFGCVGTACVRLKRVTCPHPAACRARSPMRWGRRASSAERRAPRGSCSNPARTRISSRASGARRAGRSRPRCDAARRMRAACSAPPFTCGRGTARCRCA